MLDSRLGISQANIDFGRGMGGILSVDDDYALWWLLLQARDAAIRLRRKELRQWGVSVEEAAVLFIMKLLADKATPAEISRWLLRKHHTVLGILNRMEQKGLTKRIRDSDRKNLTRVILTEKGQQAFYRAVQIDSIHRIMSCLSEEEKKQLGSYVRRLRDVALGENEMEERPPFP